MNGACPACQSPNLCLWFTKLSSSDGREYPIFRCASCGSAFVLPRPTSEYLKQYYTGTTSSHATMVDINSETASYEKVLANEAAYPNSSIDSERIVNDCRRFCSGSRFLDIGAGYGFFSHSALDHGFKVTAIEPTEICRKVFKLMNGFEPLQGMLSDKFVDEHAGVFDVVLMSQVLEHIPDLESTLKSVSMLLAPNGIVAIAVPHFGSWLSRVQGKGDMYIVPPEHVNYFSKAGLVSLFERHGLNCRKIHTVSRINIPRVARRVPIPMAGKLVAMSVLAGVLASDFFNGGMFLNAYFQKMNRS